jgi:serine/threonine protein kinase
MGVVYKAVDTKLDREVALKFLPNHLLGDEDVRKRFEREAKASAALSHANVCHVYEIDKAEDKTFISMELIEGESLYKTIEQGPLKLEQVLNIAQQIAAGLEAAHKKGVVHRDIKPENIIIGDDGHATIMDFGLAQLTQASRLTKANQTMGTVFYMSPEQTEGADTDQRTDIWSLGVVIYEMVTGQHPFKGDYDKAVMYSILNEEPEPMTAVRTGVPMELELFVGKCLAKDCNDRYAHVAELATDLRSVVPRPTAARTQLGPLPGTTMSKDPSAERVGFQLSGWKLVILLLVVFGAGVLSWGLVQSDDAPVRDRTVRRFSLDLPDSISISTAIYRSGSVRISPNGRHIAIADASDSHVWIRDLHNTEWRSSNVGPAAREIFWSPDSRSIGVIQDRNIKQVDVENGRVSTVCSSDDLGIGSGGGSWSPDGASIVFSAGYPRNIFEVNAAGGAPEILLSSQDGSSSLLSPNFLDFGPKRRVLSLVSGLTLASTTLELHDLVSGRRQVIGPGRAGVYLAASGHLLYESTRHVNPPLITAQKLSAELEPIGEPFTLNDEGRTLSLASDGTLVHLSSIFGKGERLAWFDRSGNRVAQIPLSHGWIGAPSLSPDDQHVALTATDGGSQDIWVWNLQREVKTRVSSLPGNEFMAEWSPSGDQIVFSSDAGGSYLSSPGGQMDERQLLDGVNRVSDWSVGGSDMLYETSLPGRGISRITKTGDDWTKSVWLQTEWRELAAKISPDEKYVAYVSDQSGRSEVYVRPLNDREEQWTVSDDGGRGPRWSPQGDELFYVEGDTLVAVEISSDPEFSIGKKTELFRHPTLGRFVIAQYDVRADGRQFILAEPVMSQDEVKIHVVQNWYEEFRDRDRD